MQIPGHRSRCQRLLLLLLRCPLRCRRRRIAGALRFRHCIEPIGIARLKHSFPCRLISFRYVLYYMSLIILLSSRDSCPRFIIRRCDPAALRDGCFLFRIAHLCCVLSVLFVFCFAISRTLAEKSCSTCARPQIADGTQWAYRGGRPASSRERTTHNAT